MKKLFIMALAALLITPFVIVSCQKESVNDFEYIENNKKITITRYTGEAKNVVIPKKINRYPVTVLEDEAFSFKKLTGVVIPDTVKIIGNYTFSGNQLTGINIPNSVTYIGKNAFMWNQLTSLNIPDSVEFIGDYAFLGSKLTSLSLPSNAEIELNAFNVFIYDTYNKNGRQGGKFNIVFTAADGFNIAVLNETFAEIVLYTDTAKKDAIIPDSINGIPVISVGYCAFFGYQLTNITIPNSVRIIGPRAFAGNNFNNVTIPNSVTVIGDDSFRESNITGVNIPNSVTVIGSSAFTRNKLTGVTLPNSVASIGDSAFTYNQLTDITIPNSVVSIGHYAFVNNQIKSVTIPGSVTDLGFGAFDADVEIIRE